MEMNDKPDLEDRRIPEELLSALIAVEAKRDKIMEVRIRLSNVLDDLKNEDATLEIEARDINMRIFEHAKTIEPGLHLEEMLTTTRPPAHWKFKGEPAPDTDEE